VEVVVASAFAAQLKDAGIEPEEFRQHFESWKAQWPKNEYSFEFFGKDAAYSTPQVHGQPEALRHVHLMPLHDSVELSRWRTAFRFKRRKTSDRHLVYAQSGTDSYLLIIILDAPTAHEIARMQTSTDRALMQTFCDIADNFVYYGDVP